ncbi:MAG: sigma-70 family RNA polymerase sigma factor [Planctomycetota bacterium]|nr:sigma-70 family RNA polymerase sigma factor [Planctomycetota bacterium]
MTVDEATQALTQLSGGDSSGADAMLSLVYTDLRALAGSYFRRQPHDHTLQPTALVHEAYLRLIDQTNMQITDRAHFFAIAATAMRQILINHAKKRSTLKRGGDRRQLTLEDRDNPSSVIPIEDILAINEAMKKLELMDDRKNRVVEMRIFGGLTMEEIAYVLNVSKSTVEGDWRMAKAWLSRQLSEETSHDPGAISED